MTQKTEIVAELAEQAVLLPMLVQRGLLANEQAKYYFSLLQTARQQAEHPERAVPVLRIEREAAGITDAALDGVVPGTAQIGDGLYRIPHLGRILEGIREAIDEMLRPLVASGMPNADALDARRTALAGSLQVRAADEIERAGIGALTLGGRSSADSLHLLVMDLHRGLNALLERLAGETIDGAQAYMLGDGDGDRELVRAFMRGLNRTAPLRFDHPGLGTTATRAGDRLVIQNDIGMTEAHVLVIAVVQHAVTITYTDVHMPRVAFFQSLFDDWEVTWSETLSRSEIKSAESGGYYLSVGKFNASDYDRCAAFLDHLGSRLVFLIDWNKARKRLRPFLSNRDATAVLREAAAAGVGHRGFLELGGDRLIYSALDPAARVPPLFGRPLHLHLGRQKTMEYLAWVLRTAAEGLLRGEPHALLQDRCRAELLRYIRPARSELLERCAAHAALVVDVSLELQALVSSLRPEAWTGCNYSCSAQNRLREEEASLVLSEVRVLAHRTEENGLFPALIQAQDDALNALAEGCHYATLLDAGDRYPAGGAGLEAMADLAVTVGREFVGALSAAQAVYANQESPALQEFVAATNRVIQIGQENEAARWRTERSMLAEVREAGSIHVWAGLLRAIAASTRALARAACLLREGTLTEPRG